MHYLDIPGYHWIADQINPWEIKAFQKFRRTNMWMKLQEWFVTNTTTNIYFISPSTALRLRSNRPSFSLLVEDHSYLQRGLFQREIGWVENFSYRTRHCNILSRFGKMIFSTRNHLSSVPTPLYVTKHFLTAWLIDEMSPSKYKFLILGDKTRGKFTGSTNIKLTMKLVSLSFYCLQHH